VGRARGSVGQVLLQIGLGWASSSVLREATGLGLKLDAV
jgi:hypothetical protein